MTLHLERNAPSHATGPSCTEATVHRTTDGKTPTGFHHAAIDSKPDDQPCSFEKRRAPVVIHTLPVAAIGILTGITLQDRFAETCLVATLICPILFILTGASALATPNWRPNTRLSPRLSTVAIFCGFLMLGSLRMHVTQISSLPVDWKRLVAEHPSLMRVECTVLTLPRRFAANHDKEQLQPKASDRSTFLCDVDSIVTGDGPVPASGRMRLSVPSLQPDLEPGDRIAATLRPRPIRAPTNPGQFDQRKAATRIGVVARASCVYASQIQRLSSRTLPRVSLHRYREHARRTLLRGISDTDTSGLVTT
ncbi:MAG: ComEC/Rec2 family competence protein, partial [Phycisphaerae bacterium]